MNNLKYIFIVLIPFWLTACSDQTEIIYDSQVEAIQTCSAEFITDVEFKYSVTYFRNGNAFVRCELTDFLLNRTVSSTRFYSGDSVTSEATRLVCGNLHELSALAGGEFIYDIVGGVPGVTFVDYLAVPTTTTTTYSYLVNDCVVESF